MKLKMFVNVSYSCLYSLLTCIQDDEVSFKYEINITIGACLSFIKGGAGEV